MSRNAINPDRALSAVSESRIRKSIRALTFASLDGLRNCALNSGGLGTKAASKDTVETTAAVIGLVDGKLLSEAAGDMAALSGTVANDAFNVFMFSVDLGGTVYSQMGVEGASLALIEFPPIEDSRAVLGFVIINPTGTGDFVGGTTELDDGTVTPNAVYVNTPFPFNPHIEG